MQTAALQDKTEELNAMREKLTSLELAISSCKEEKGLSEVIKYQEKQNHANIEIIDNNILISIMN